MKPYELDLLVWLLENQIHTIKRERIFTGEDKERIKVTFIAESFDDKPEEKRIVSNWRGEIEGIIFHPSYSGLVKISNYSADQELKLRSENKDLIEERAQLRLRMKEIDSVLKPR